MTPGTITGTTTADVTPVSTNGGVITVLNNGGHVSATIIPSPATASGTESALARKFQIILLNDFSF
jgi:hypothetical protein